MLMQLTFGLIVQMSRRKKLMPFHFTNKTATNFIVEKYKNKFFIRLTPSVKRLEQLCLKHRFSLKNYLWADSSEIANKL